MSKWNPNATVKEGLSTISAPSAGVEFSLLFLDIDNLSNESILAIAPWNESALQ